MICPKCDSENVMPAACPHCDGTGYDHDPRTDGDTCQKCKGTASQDGVNICRNCYNSFTDDRPRSGTTKVAETCQDKLRKAAARLDGIARKTTTSGMFAVSEHFDSLTRIAKELRDAADEHEATIAPK